MEWSKNTSELILNELIKYYPAIGEEYILVRFGENAIYKTIDTVYAIRIHRPKHTKEEIQKEIDVAIYLYENGFPTIKPSEKFNGVFCIKGFYITIWDWLESEKPKLVDYEKYGKLLADFHSISKKVNYDVPRFNLYKRMKGSLKHTNPWKDIEENEYEMIKKSVKKLEDLWINEYSRHLNPTDFEVGVSNVSKLRLNVSGLVTLVVYTHPSPLSLRSCLRDFLSELYD